MNLTSFSHNLRHIKLEDLGKFYCGLSRKAKSDFIDGNAKFITYKNIYNNIGLDIDMYEKVKIEIYEKQNTLQYGDIIFTGSSETLAEVGLSSVVMNKVEQPIYLNSFCFLFRLDNPKLLLPAFSKHLFRSNILRNQIIKTADGTTRFNISKKLMKKVIIPLPSLKEQSKIAETLDKFFNIISLIKNEINVRQKQYEYYINKLLSCDYKD